MQPILFYNLVILITMTDISYPHFQQSKTVLIPDGDGGFILKLLDCLSLIPEIPIVYLLSSFPFTPARFSMRRVSIIRYEKPESEEQWVHIIRDAMQTTCADILLPHSNEFIRLIAAHRDVFPPEKVVPLPPLESFDIAANKWKLANFLRMHHISTPPTILYANDAQVEKDLDILRFPVLVKPVDREGGQGISAWNERTSLKKHLQEYGNPGKTIIQKYLAGYFIGCNVLCKDGKILAHTIQTALYPPKNPFTHPLNLRFEPNEQVFRLAECLVKALNWSGIANIDMFYDQETEKINILEINPRFWDTLLGSLGAGVNFPYLACLAGLGVPFDKPIFNSVSYLSGSGIFRALLSHKNWGSGSGFSFKRTDIYYLMRDPVAMLVLKITRLKKRIEAVWKTRSYKT